MICLPCPGIGAKRRRARSAAAVRARARQARREGVFGKLIVVAFTDANDLLSYRLMNSRYENAPTSARRLRRRAGLQRQDLLQVAGEPLHRAHDLRHEPDVARFIACGNPTNARCR